MVTILINHSVFVFTTFSFLGIVFCIHNRVKEGQLGLGRLYAEANKPPSSNYFDLILHYEDVNLNLEGEGHSVEVFLWCAGVLSTVSAHTKLGWLFFLAHVTSVCSSINKEQI